MTLKDNIKRQSLMYIDAVLAGMEGELLRWNIHKEFVRCLPGKVDPDSLIPILHNLDQVIGFTVEMVGKKVPKKEIEHWGNELFKKLWKFYIEVDERSNNGKAD